MSEVRLPEVPDFGAYRQIYLDAEIWLPAMQEICQRHHLPLSELQRLPTGSAVVYECAGQVIKLFAPLWPEEYARENLGLEFFAQKLFVQTPEPLASGYLDQWPYLIMRKLPGVALGQIWAQLPQAEQVDLALQMGTLLQSIRKLGEAAEFEYFSSSQSTDASDAQRQFQTWSDYVQSACKTSPHSSVRRASLKTG